MLEIKTIDDLKGQKRYDKCKYYCIDCNTEVEQMVQTARRSGLRCIKCLRKQKGTLKYGSEDGWKDHLKETKAKGDKTLIEKTGDPHIRHTLYKEGCLRKYGVDNSSKLEKHREYMTNHNPACRPEVRQKISESMSNRTAEELRLAHEKYIRTMMEHYGVQNLCELPDFQKKTHRNRKYKIDNYYFDSVEEVLFYNYHLAIGNKIVPHPDTYFTYEYDNKTHLYFPDFEVNGQYYEIKGHHYLKEDGTWHNPYTKDNSDDGLYEAKHQCVLKNTTLLYDYDLQYMIDYFWENRGSFPYLNKDLSNTSDNGLIQHFHKSLYDATRKGKPSPKEAWDIEILYKKCIINRLKYMGKCDPNSILQGFNVSKIAPKVSVFKVSLAQDLLKKYCNYDTIFDPFSGFSGRLLGANNLGKHYIGQDINEDHVRESNEIIQYKNIMSTCSVKIQDILTDSIHNFSNTTLFTCPPYGGKEHWNKNNDEIEKTCDEWIDICLDKYKCNEYLFVVDTTSKYKDYIVETLENQSHFGENEEYVIYLKR